MDTDSLSEPSSRRTWIVLLTVLGIAIAGLTLIAVAIFQHPVTVRCTGFTRRNYGPQFVATNHTDKHLSINIVTEHREAGGWIADTNWPVAIDLPPHSSGNCFADNNVKTPWHAHVIVFSDVTELALLPRLRAYFSLRRAVRLGALALPTPPSASSATFVLAPTEEFYIAGPTPPTSSSE